MKKIDFFDCKAKIALTFFALVMGGTFLQTSCDSKKESKMNEYPSQEVSEADAELKKTANDLNMQCPVDQMNGLVLESVTYSDNVFQYAYSCPDATFKMKDNDPKGKETIKNLFVASPESKEFIDYLIKSCSKLKYYYYTEKGRTSYIIFTQNELKTFFE